MSDTIHTGKATPEQVTYANMLFYGCWGGLALMAVTYLLYVFGIITPHVPLEKVPLLWSQPVGTYLELGNVPTGWGWSVLIAKGDFLNFLGIVLLAGMTIVCYIPLIPAFLKRKELVFAALALAEIIVLLFAASGIVGGGAH
ncbi:MAG: DUF1634 domain-containing protein [Humidesulfovibrio sp.]|uniref:DUF1634 domain-containing protein n=1 Tax=Humidesulfovibrio sp. TaxID=2910988 RepID=UPI0027F691DD|nr:DUF1634 domain-containing protein [Humidesulfovibrio sp.]MDQ7835028.1 DUF1634 domain-containing protein [Humidesulfovibrio sp.]